MKARVLFCIPGYRYGGIESNTEYICRFAAEAGVTEFGLCVEKQDIEIDFSLYEKKGWKIYQINRRFRHRPLRYCLEMMRIIKEGDYSVIHSFNERRTPIYFFAGKFTGVKIRVFHPRTTRLDGNLCLQGIGRAFVRLSTLLATHCCACSHNVGKFMFKNRPYVVINNALDTDMYPYSDEERAAVRGEFDIDGKKVLIGHVGRFCEAKNHGFLLQVFAKTVQKGLDAELLLVGDGPLIIQAQTLTKSLGIVDRVRYLGRRTDVERLYQAMDVLLFPSIYEGYPNVIVEAQTSGLRCLMTDCITPDAILTDQVKTLPLDAGVDVWAAQLIELSQPYPRHSQKAEIISSGHDAKTETRRLLTLYDQWVDEAYADCN